jgi:hypothetical protein
MHATVGIFLDDLPRVVARPVVDHDHLDVPVRLRQRRFDRLAHEAPVVVAGDHDRYQRLGLPVLGPARLAQQETVEIARVGVSRLTAVVGKVQVRREP